MKYEILIPPANRFLFRFLFRSLDPTASIFESYLAVRIKYSPLISPSVENRTCIRVSDVSSQILLSAFLSAQFLLFLFLLYTNFNEARSVAKSRALMWSTNCSNRIGNYVFFLSLSLFCLSFTALLLFSLSFFVRFLYLSFTEGIILRIKTVLRFFARELICYLFLQA